MVEKIQAERKRIEKNEEDTLNEELEVAIEQLGKGENRIGKQALIDYIEELRAKKSVLVEEKGKRLAEKLGTKWYNEGEKSNRYFMRLLNRNNPDNFTKIEGNDGQEIVEEKEIERTVVDFYKNLYENFNTTVIEENDINFFQELDLISEEDDGEMCQDVTENDLRTTLLTCKDSSPGPDGIPYSIIGLVWSVFGPTLAAAWKYSLSNRCLAPSHKLSYLKLIPKAGKNLNKLTNWRPITLSNCDHKLITKTYARRLSEKLAPKIDEGQTAYLKGRLINDSLRAMLATVEASNLEDMNGIIVALDAKKAFDSVSHTYIENCLKKFGCRGFILILKILYKELETDILFNGRIVKGFKIKRGVKQGDALSCILFIMCMEPLLRSIKINPNIEALSSNLLGCELPKTYAYADDVSATVKDDEDTLKHLFKEYERLTKMSGLELNADKTDLMRIGRHPQGKSYNVEYLGLTYIIPSSETIKLNGIIFHRNLREGTKLNVMAAIGRMESHFKNWSRRGLSTLGKILLTKTFVISQVIYLMQAIKIDENNFKAINACLYKFIWNKHYLAAKAPERLKREIVNKSVKFGGLGMLDVSELDASIELRALGRVLKSNHTFLKRLVNKLDLRSFFEPKYELSIEGVLEKGVELLKADRNKLWSCSDLSRHRNFLNIVRNEKIKDILNKKGRVSVIFFMINRQAKKIKDLSLQQDAQLERFIDKAKLEKLRLAIRLNINSEVDSGMVESYYVGNSFKHLMRCTSKEIRLERTDKNPITSYKLGLVLSSQEALSWC